MEFEIQALDFSDLHFDDVEESLAELAAENVLVTGTYPAAPLKVEAYLLEERQMASVQYGLLSENGKVIRKVRLKFSWIKEYKNGRIDKPFRMFSALRKALGNPAPAEVVPLAGEVPVRINVSEAYIVPEGSQHAIHADRYGNQGEVWCILDAPNGSNDEDIKAARMHYVGLGLEPIYLVQNVYEA